METAYGEAYRELYQRHFWWRAREELIVATLKRLRPTGRWGPILDVGCGDGLFFPRLASFGEPEGIEPDGALVSRESRERYTIHVRPFDEFFQPGKRYGLVLLLDVLEHVPEPVRLLRSARDLLADDGVVLVTVPAFQLLWTHHDVLNQHLARYRRAELRDQIRESGLALDEIRYFSHWTFPGKVLVSLKEKFFGANTAPPRVPLKPVNGFFYRLSVLEQVVLRPFPFLPGSSLIAVAGRGAG